MPPSTRALAVKVPAGIVTEPAGSRVTVSGDDVTTLTVTAVEKAV